mgnify:FL=1
MNDIGSILSIPQSALNAIDQADKKLKDIQNTAKATATSVAQSFKDMSVGTKPFLDSLDQIVAKLSVINSSASNASGGITNMSTSVSGMNGSITQASISIQNMVAQLSKMNGTGTSGIMQAVLAFQRLQESTRGASGMNIAQLKQDIGAIESILRDTTYNLTKADQDELIKHKNALQDELRYQQQMYNERTVAFQKALDKMVSAEQSYNNKQRKIYADRAKDYQTRNNKVNTTYQGALDFSASANTLNRQVRAIEYLKEARMKLSTIDADYKQKLSILNNAIAEHNKKLKEAGVNTKQLTEQTSYMAGYLSRWAQRMAFAFSINTVKGFVEQVAEVRGQFELSQISLESIIQNKQKADEIFNKTVQLAIKSPFRIKDLIDYTRQLSAYRIESDKLYDTTKRLADVSAGLGVDMGRLILAYGQVKAAAYLRGSEVRQFTEAGVNMYGELQDYFKEVKGEAYTTAQIVDMISKRMVKFEDVEAIFQRMTDKGGMFYNMQEVQSNTLYGMIQKMHDAFDVMLNDIGKANEGSFKGLINSATQLLKHWEAIANTGKTLAGVIALMALYMKQMGVSKVSSLFTQIISSEGKATSSTILFKNALAQAGNYAKVLGQNLKAAFASNIFTLSILALTSVVAGTISALRELREAEAEIGAKYYKNTAQLNMISEAYESISKSASKANKSESDKSSIATIEAKRKKLQELLNLSKSSGLDFNINVQFINADKIDETFDDIKSKYKSFVTQMAVIEHKLAENKSLKDHWYIPVDDFEKDAKQYSAAAAELLTHANQIDDAVIAISGHQEEATERTRAYYQEVKAGRKAGESELDYYERMYILLEKIGKGKLWRGSGTEKMAARIRESTFKNLAGVLKVQREELDGELDDIFKDTSERFAKLYGRGSKQYRLLMSAEIDARNLDMQVADYAKKKYNAIQIPASVDGKNADREVKTIIQSLQEYADRNKIKLNVSVADPKNLLGTIEGYQKSAKDWAETIKSIERSDFKHLSGDFLDISTSKKWKGTFVDGATIFSKKRALEYAKEQLQAALLWNKTLGGKDPFASTNKRGGSKTQRDILQERISLLKDMNAKYNELIKIEGKEQALFDTRMYFKEAAQNVGWSADDILPSDKDIAKKIRELAKTTNDISKKGNYLRIAADVELRAKEQTIKEQAEQIANEVQKAFDELNLYKKLKGVGVGDGLIGSMFGNIATSFTDVRKKIEKSYVDKYGSDKNKWGTEATKKYADDMRKLDKEIYQGQINTFTEITKAYGQQLSDQLQLDRWYIEERKKIMDSIADSDTKNLYLSNLKKEYDKKSDENAWKEFQNSDMYISLFDNIDQASTRMLTAMRDKLESLRGSLKNLSPEQLKQIVTRLNEVDEKIAYKNPFKGLTSGIKEYVKYASKRKSLEEKNIASRNKTDELKKQSEEQNRIVVSAKQEYDEASKTYGALSGQAALKYEAYRTEKEKLDIILKELVAEGKITEETAEQIRNGEKAKKTLQNQLHSIGQGFSEVSGTISETFEMLNDWGLNIDMSDEVQEVVGGLDKIGSSLDSIDLMRPASIIKGLVGVVGGIGKTLGGIFGWGTKDKRLQREIEKQQKIVERLQNAYNDLKEAMENAFDIKKLSEYNDKVVENLKAQNASLQAMINAERSKKKTDKDKIEEYQRQIEENNKAIKEAEETLTETLGGFGSQANYKSAAEAFAEAWVDAYNEGSDALDALNDKFDEYFNNMLKKQLTARAASRYIQPILDAFDAAVTEGSDGGHNGLDVTKEELENIKKLKDTNLELFNEYAKGLMEVLGVSPTGSSNISALQQGIKSVTEATAQAIESIINSIRYYVAQQQQDIRIIRDTLLEKLGNSVSAISQDTSNSPMLVELRLQTTILTDIRDTLSSCVRGGHKLGRSGIKVFMD